MKKCCMYASVSASEKRIDIETIFNCMIGANASIALHAEHVEPAIFWSVVCARTGQKEIKE